MNAEYHKLEEELANSELREKARFSEVESLRARVSELENMLNEIKERVDDRERRHGSYIHVAQINEILESLGERENTHASE